MSKGIPFANPYVIDRPVVEVSHFYGRLDILAWIEKSLEEGERFLVVQGPYRIGKSSLLYQLGAHLGSKYMVFPVGEMAESRLDLLLWQIALTMTSSLPEGSVFEEPRREDFEGQASYFGEEFLPRFSKVVGGKSLLLALDDFHLWAGSETSDVSALQAELLSYLTSLRVALLLTWEGPLEGEILSRAVVWRLGPLDRDEARRLITEPSAEILDYDYEAQERILALTSGHPYFVQLLCYALFERCASKGWVLIQDVDEVVPESMALGKGYLEHLLATSSPQEQLALAALGAMRGIQGLILEEEVSYLMQRRRIPLSPEKLRMALDRLVERGVLVSMASHTYRFQVELLRAWLGRKEGFGASLAGEVRAGRKERASLRRFFWPIAAALLVILLFLWSMSSRSGPPTGGEGDRGEQVSPTPTTIAALAVSPTQPTPVARQTIAYMFWEEESGTWEISLMASDGSNRTPLTQNEVDDTWPSWSYDGRRLLFVSERDGNREIYHMNADGSEQVNLSRNSAPDSSPSFSPDGMKIAFASHRDGNWEIYIMDADGSQQARVTFNEGPDYAPVWSPDGTKIAFVSERDGNKEIYVMEADGSEEMRLTNNEATDTSPAWSPDGTKIAFESYRDEDMEIYIMNTDGSGQRNLTNDHTVDDYGPSWSPDGTKIVYYAYRDGNWDLYVMGVDGTGRVNLTNSAEAEQGPAWRP